MDFFINCTPDGLKEYPLHHHGHYEIMLYLEGEGILRTDREEIPFRPGTVIIVPPGMEHGSACREGFKNISLGGPFGHLLFFDKITVLSDNDRGEGRMLACLIYENRYANGAYLEALCTAYLRFLLQNSPREESVFSAVQGIARALSQGVEDSRINPTALLADSGYAEDYIRAQFKKIMGKTPTEFLTEQRIRRACFLIDIYGASLPLTRIAESCGFLDYVYFSKKFKAITGRSPREYKVKRSEN